jgi:hypothetical protein
MLTKITNFIKYRYQRLLLWLFISPQLVLADDNPFPIIPMSSGGVVQTTGGYMETTFKYALISGGGLLILVCLATIVHRMREDSREKDHGNLVMTFILLALGLTLGFILIGVGWTAFSAQPQPPS